MVKQGYDNGNELLHHQMNNIFGKVCINQSKSVGRGVIGKEQNNIIPPHPEIICIQQLSNSFGED